MRRRDFIKVIACWLAVWPFVARAQPATMPVIGFLGGGSPETDGDLVAGFRQGLSESGYVEGRNVSIEYRWAENKNDRLPALVSDLIRRQVNVIIGGNTPGAVAAKAATATIPIVFLTASDPVAAGFAASLNRPGGNLTGVTFLGVEIGRKHFELMREVVPTASTIAFLLNPTNRTLAEPLTRDAQAAAHSLGLKLHVLHASTERDIENAFTTLAQLRADALVIGTDLFFTNRSKQLAALTARHSVPAIYHYRGIRDGRRFDELRRQCCRGVPPSRRLHRPDPQGREACRSAGAASDQGRADPEPQDRQGARAHGPDVASRARRRGNRMRLAPCPLLALSGHARVHCTCPLLGVKRTFIQGHYLFRNSPAVSLGANGGRSPGHR